MIKAIIASLVTIGGYVIVWITAEAKFRQTWYLPCVLIALSVLGVAMICVEHFEHRADLASEHERANGLEATLSSTRAALEATRDEVAKLRAEEKARDPRLIYLADYTRWQRDANTGLLFAAYVFRAKPPGPLRDIRIELAFSAPLANALPRIHGALVEELGSRLEILPDRRGLIYTTGMLREGNDVVIQVFADHPLDLQSRSLSP